MKNNLTVKVKNCWETSRNVYITALKLKLMDFPAKAHLSRILVFIRQGYTVLQLKPYLSDLVHLSRDHGPS